MCMPTGHSIGTGLPWMPRAASLQCLKGGKRAQTGVLAGKWAIVHRIINGELMSDTIFFQILESGSLVDLHTKFGGSNSKGRKKCHALGGGNTVLSTYTVRLCCLKKNS